MDKKVIVQVSEVYVILCFNTLGITFSEVYYNRGVKDITNLSLLIRCSVVLKQTILFQLNYDAP